MTDDKDAEIRRLRRIALDLQALAEEAPDQGEELASELGDTFITCWTEAPVEQWRTIVRMLDEAGYEVVRKKVPGIYADTDGKLRWAENEEAQ